MDQCRGVVSPCYHCFRVICIERLIVFYDFSLTNNSTCYSLNLFNSFSADQHVGVCLQKEYIYLSDQWALQGLLIFCKDCCQSGSLGSKECLQCIHLTGRKDAPIVGKILFIGVIVRLFSEGLVLGYVGKNSML